MTYAVDVNMRRQSTRSLFPLLPPSIHRNYSQKLHLAHPCDFFFAPNPPPRHRCAIRPTSPCQYEYDITAALQYSQEIIHSYTSYYYYVIWVIYNIIMYRLYFTWWSRVEVNKRSETTGCGADDVRFVFRSQEWLSDSVSPQNISRSSYLH